jgi:hypothetical protein
MLAIGFENSNIAKARKPPTHDPTIKRKNTWFRSPTDPSLTTIFAKCGNSTALKPTLASPLNKSTNLFENAQDDTDPMPTVPANMKFMGAEAAVKSVASINQP